MKTRWAGSKTRQCEIHLSRSRSHLTTRIAKFSDGWRENYSTTRAFLIGEIMINARVGEGVDRESTSRPQAENKKKSQSIWLGGVLQPRPAWLSPAESFRVMFNIQNPKDNSHHFDVEKRIQMKNGAVRT